MKSKFLLPLILIAGLMIVDLSGFQVYAQAQQKKTATVQTVKYTCPMHPEVVMDQPGNCPKCGMKLVEKKAMPNGNMQKMNNSKMMKHDHVNMMNDSTNMKKGQMMHDTTSMKQNQMKM